MPVPRVLRHGVALARAAGLVVAFASSVVLGQPAPAADPPAPPLPAEYTEEARRAYSAGLGEARDLLREKRYPEAIAKLDSLIARRPREAQARFLKALALAESGQTAGAVEALRALSADFPELPEPRNNLAVIYAGQGNYALARDELLLAVAAAPDYAVAHDNLGDIYVRLAIDHYARASALEKSPPRIESKLKAARELIAAPAP